LHARVTEQRRGNIRQHDAPAFHGITAIAHLQGEPGVLLDQQDKNPGQISIVPEY